MRRSRISQASSAACCAVGVRQGVSPCRWRRRNSSMVQTGAAMPRTIWYFRMILHQLAGLAAGAAQPGRRHAAANAGRAPRDRSSDEIIIRVPIRPRPWPADRMGRKQGPQMPRRRSRSRAPCCPGRSTSISSCATAAGLRARLDSDCPALDFYGGFYRPARRRPALRAARRHPLAHGGELPDRAVPRARAPAQALALSLTISPSSAQSRGRAALC